MKRAAITLAFVLSAAPAGAQDQPGYKLDVPEHLDVDTGGGTLPLTITVERGQTISKDGGLTLDIAPDAGISVRGRTVAETEVKAGTWEDHIADWPEWEPPEEL